MAQSSFQFPVIGPLVTRHAEDTAFYWSQLDRAATSPQVGFEKLLQFSRLHDAHLGGVIVAGAGGWRPALAALERWKKAGEAYVCTRIALQHDDPDRLDGLVRIVARRPAEMLRGVISALACAGDNANGAIHRWSALEADPVAQVAALRAAALLGPAALSSLAASLERYFSVTSPDVRSAACRAAAVAEKADAVPLLQATLESEVLQERTEAAIALLAHEPAASAWTVLRDSVLAQAQLHDAATGWHRKQSARRLRRWTMELALASEADSGMVQETLSLLPPRTALTFALCLGDLANLPFVASHAATPGVERYAGWVWQALSGIDLAARGWTLPEPDPSTFDGSQPITEAQPDADDGLPLPDPGAIGAHSSVHASSLIGKRVLMGRELDFAHALGLTENGPQAIRVLAARALRRIQPAITVNVRAPAPRQRQAMVAIRHAGERTNGNG